MALSDLDRLRERLAAGSWWRRQFRAVGTRAAVAVVLREGPDGVEVLLTERARREGDPWSGHVAFPGGVRHDDDPDDRTTAIRETREEVGIDLEHAECVGRQPAWLTRTHRNWMPMVVVPWVFVLDRPVAPVLNHEVAEVFWVPLRRLDATPARRPWRFAGGRWAMPAWDWQGHIIWGLTYQMLRSLLRQLD